MKDIQQIYEDRRRHNKLSLKKREEQVYINVPEIKDIRLEIRKLNLERISKAIKGQDTSDISHDINNLIEKKEEIFINNNIPLDYLELKYHCNICKDTGVVGTRRCQCYKKLKVLKLQEDSQIDKIIEEQNFDNFNLELFRKSRQNGELISPYENMKEEKEELEAYSKNFQKNSANLYIYGPVGTGKTYILNCIAKEVLDLEHSVIYLSEANLVDTILEHKFAYSEAKAELKPKIDAIFNSDLLIIDDLGANATNENTKSALFEVINSRLVKKLPVVISSNLDPEELRSKYDTRIYSRIIGEYYPKRFYGNDIRML